jgi:hypothetical protein
MDSEDLVERLVSERQLVAASEMKFNSLLGDQPLVSTRRMTVHHRREVYSRQRTARDEFGRLCQGFTVTASNLQHGVLGPKLQQLQRKLIFAGCFLCHDARNDPT